MHLQHVLLYQLQRNVHAELKLVVFQVRSELEIVDQMHHNGLHQHVGVLGAQAVSRAGTRIGWNLGIKAHTFMMASSSVPERNVRIGVDLLKVLGQESVRVEHVAIGTPNRFIALHFHDTKDDVRTSRYPVFICWALEKQLYTY